MPDPCQTTGCPPRDAFQGPVFGLKRPLAVGLADRKSGLASDHAASERRDIGCRRVRR